MARSVENQGKARFIPATLALAGLALTIPAAGLAVVHSAAAPVELPESLSHMPFTPARMDPQLARRVAALIGEDGLRFTPASKPALSRDRTITVAVRVDDATARAISVRSAIDSVGSDQGAGRMLAIAPTSYNLGIARGYQSFAQPAKAESVTVGVRDMGMPDLASYRPEGEDKPAKPGRFGSRLSLHKEDAAGRSPRTLEGSGGQSVDLSTSYRVVGGLDVTAGVRLSKDSNRLAPLTDGLEDDQAVYVGTRISF